jgi:hypothetical protein
MRRKVKIGDKFKRLTVLEHIGSEMGYRMWKCQCDCGNICNVRSHDLLAGRKGSCGCLYKEKWQHQGAGCREGHPLWKGGRLKGKNGYVIVLTPEGHPPGSIGNGRYCFEHRLVMEKHIGRYLLPGEMVHHKNGIKSDNRPENLELMKKSQHSSGQNVNDLVEYAVTILKKYKPDLLKE